MSDVREKEEGNLDLEFQNRRLLQMNLELEQNLKKCTPKSSRSNLIDFNRDMSKAIETLEYDKKMEELELQVESFLNQN